MICSLSHFKVTSLTSSRLQKRPSYGYMLHSRLLYVPKNLRIMEVQNPEIRRKRVDDKRKREEEGIKQDLIQETLASRKVLLPLGDMIEIIRIPVKGAHIYNDALISISKELAMLNKLTSEGVLLSARVKTKNRTKNEEKHRIKTTVGFDYETYTKLKILSIILKENMQDIIAKALHEYFEKEDIKRILNAYFVSTSSSTDSK